MRRPGGYAVLTDPERTVECDTFTCAHCNHVVHVKANTDPADAGGLCKQCMGLICPRCVGKGCTPFERQLEQWEARAAALKSYGVG